MLSIFGWHGQIYAICWGKINIVQTTALLFIIPMTDNQFSRSLSIKSPKVFFNWFHGAFVALHFRLLIVDASHCDAVYDTRYKSMEMVSITLHPIRRNNQMLSSIAILYLAFITNRDGKWKENTISSRSSTVQIMMNICKWREKGLCIIC